MEVQVTQAQPAESDADLVCIGLFEGEDLPPSFADVAGAAEVKGGYRKAILLRPGQPQRLLVVGLGERAEFDPERARVAAAVAAKTSSAVEARTIAWQPPDAGAPAEIAAALVEGTILAAYRFDRYRSPNPAEEDPVQIESLTLLGESSLSESAEAARVGAEAANRARDLQNLPANVATPIFLADRAAEIVAAHEKLSLETMDRDEIVAKGMGGLAAVSQGSSQEPRLIVMRYSGKGSGTALGLVGKAVTFDTGGISIKPSAGMQEMKMDMSGGAAVIEAVAAIAELDLPIDVIAVVPATENMPSGSAVKPGDVITQYNGKTVEVNNTDAEGRLILADALAYCVELGAERVVDLATLTGAVLVALGSTYAALISNDDDWASTVDAAGAATGELLWRLPLHEEYKQLFKGTVADFANVSEKRKAGTIYAGSFLEEFVGETPWAHLDIAGTAWDIERAYASKGPTGFGVRLLISLARSLTAS